MFSKYVYQTGWICIADLGSTRLVMELDEYEHPLDGVVIDRPLPHEDIIANYSVFKSVYHVEQRLNKRHLQQLLNFKDYRKVDVSHINRLRSLTEIYAVTDTLQCVGQPVPIVEGYAILQPNYILATEISKAIDPAGFNETLGHQYVKDNLRPQIDDRLWQLEGYRLMRNVHSLDNIIENSGDRKATHLAITRIANGGLVVYSSTTDLVYIITYGAHYQPVFIGSEGRLSAGYSILNKETYLRIITLLDTYIELQ